MKTRQNESEIIITGPAGKIQMVVTKPVEPSTGCGIICHPHPLFGGTMTNKVVTTIDRAFNQLGLISVRFNFRGVGQTEGIYDEGRGELQDLLAVSAWVKQAYPMRSLWLAGFSFGAYIAALGAETLSPQALILVAPPVKNFPMHTLPRMTVPCLLIQGEQDDVVDPALVFEWAASRDPAPAIIRFPQAGHFFHGQLMDLRLAIEKHFER